MLMFFIIFGVFYLISNFLASFLQTLVNKTKKKKITETFSSRKKYTKIQLTQFYLILLF